MMFPTARCAVLLTLCMAAVLPAGVPATDIRNTETPNTDTHFKMRTYSSLQEWRARKRQLRVQILTAAGLLPMPRKTPLNARVFDRFEGPGYSVEKVLLETMPGFHLGGNLYRPVGKKGKFPAVLAAHGHWKHGRLEDTEQSSIPGRSINMARQGYVVFAYDMVGYNDTRQVEHTFGNKTDQLWSFGPLGLQLWNSIRAVDFVQSLKDVDDGHIAVTGASGGGTQTFLLAAVDRRITLSAPVVMVSGIMQGGCACENAPGLRLGTFNAEIAAMAAPRPMIVVSASGDWTKNVPAEEFPAIREIYALYGKAENVENYHQQANHNYNKNSREAVYRFFARHLLKDPNAANIVETPFDVPDAALLLATKEEGRTDGALDAAGVFARWKELGVGASSERRARFILASYLTVQRPRQVEASVKDNEIVMTRAGVGDRVAGHWYPGTADRRATLVIHSGGADAARKMPAVKRLIDSGEPVLLIDVFHTGKAKANRSELHKHFTTFNQTVDAARVQDILTAVAFLRGERYKSINLVGINGAGVWAVFAGAVAGAPVKVYADLGNFKGSDEDFLHHFFVPGIQRGGGLAAAARLAKPTPWVTE